MHLKVTAIAGAIALLFATASKAETIGPPVAHIKKGTIGAGVEYGTYDFKLKRDEGFNPSFDYDVTDMKATSLKATYGLVDGIGISGRIGTLGDGETDGANSNGGAHAIKGTDASGDVWGIALDALIWQSGSLAVGGMLRYSEFSWDTSETRTSGGPAGAPGRDNVNLEVIEGSLGVGYTLFGSLTPYGGVLFQKIKGNTRFARPTGPASDSPLENRESSFGYVGVRYQSPWKVTVGAEFLTNSTWRASLGVQF